MFITFLNVPEEREQEFKEKAWQTWQNVRNDLYILFACDEADEARKWLKENYGEDVKAMTTRQVFETLDVYRSEYSYGIDYVEPRTFENQNEGYIRYIFAWGGPACELRFYDSGLVEFAYLDWFTGIGFDVTDDEVVKAVHEYFEDIGLFESLKEEVKGC